MRVDPTVIVFVAVVTCEVMPLIRPVAADVVRVPVQAQPPRHVAPLQRTVLLTQAQLAGDIAPREPIQLAGLVTVGEP